MTQTGPATVRSRIRRPISVGVVVAAAIVMVAVLLPYVAAANPTVVGDAGTNTALPTTSSAVTISGRGTFSALKVTVNQTQDLLNQAISVTWTGAALPLTNGGNLSALLGNFLQIFQCWGPDDGSVASDPGPSPEDCEFGALDSNLTARNNTTEKGIYAQSRIVGSSGTPSYNLPGAAQDPANSVAWEPFHAVDGTVVGAQANFNALATKGQAEWLDPYFDYATSNEDDLAETHPDGTGSELFTVDTGLEAPGLGCGQQSEVQPDGSKIVPQCWLVIVPRGTPMAENDAANTGLPDGAGFAVATSPLYPTVWADRIAIPLGFQPIGASCAIGADERRIVGDELATPAVTSWQPTLCSTPGLPPYNYGSISDTQARQQLVSGTAGAAGMAVVSQPLDPSTVDPNDPVVYAPLTLSGLTIGFNIERTTPGKAPDPAEVALDGIRVATVNLTPRLVAKLLTESYPAQFGNLHLFTNGGTTVPKAYQWILKNPQSLVSDPDFLQFNPEFQNLSQTIPDAGGLVVEEPTSDAASALWQWILADPEAAAWMNGTPDPWGMNVNPYYSTNASINPSGVAFGSPGPNNYPKSDPFCYQGPPNINDGGLVPRPLCLLDASPYTLNMQVAAQDVRLANDGADTTLNPLALSSDLAYTSNGAQAAGNRFIMAVTDTADAAQYGLQEAGLSGAGDDSPDRSFVLPDTQTLLAGEKAMVSSPVPGVLQPDPSSAASGAYPLTMLTYAAVTPRSLDPAADADYANFISYGVGKGQVPGLAFGDLPPGFAPLPAALVTQATAAAALIKSGDPAPPASNPVTTGAPPTATTPTGGSTTPSSLASTAAPTATPSSPSTTTIGRAPKAPISLTSVRTPAIGVGFVRFTLPLLVLLGLAAALGWGLLKRRHLGSRRPG